MTTFLSLQVEPEAKPKKTQFLGKKQELNFSLCLKWLREDKCVTRRREAKTQGLQWHHLNKRSPASRICEPEYLVGSSNLNQNSRDQRVGGGFGCILICTHMGTLPLARENNTDRLTRRVTLARAVRSSDNNRPHHVRQSSYDCLAQDIWKEQAWIRRIKRGSAAVGTWVHAGYARAL